MSGKTCAICGKPSGIYPLCRDCLKLKADGKVVKCENCGEWILAIKDCPNCKPKKPEIKTQIENNEEKPQLTCIICGQDSNGMHFCKDCYYKYKDRSITLAVIKCKSFEIIDEYGNRKIKTCNGLLVRSQQEKIIADELFRRNIRWEYEKTIHYKDENGKLIPLHPDFYLTDYNLCIEHWGFEVTKDPNYLKNKAFKEKAYKEKGYKLAGTTSKDIDDISAVIDRILTENDIETN